jgi:hypothetical protein
MKRRATLRRDLKHHDWARRRQYHFTGVRLNGHQFIDRDGLPYTKKLNIGKNVDCIAVTRCL